MSSKSSKSYKYEVKGKKARDALNQEEQELFDLCQLSGVEISPAVLRIILDLLKLNVSPLTIAEMLKSMIHQGRLAETDSASSKMSSTSRPSSRKGEKSGSSRSGLSSSRDKEKQRHEKPGKSAGSHKSSQGQT
ncbi:putative mitotic-spindle organizing protein 2-like [Apostichopus japonicus]|uniref:Putative mitotic-spindle organizing protein 2-like n=1 Tax=Stichopus japonicus TaxID=307972 RepID=A0A2G8KUH9_STIJA|nr:putative mitotic-spindle organizing protein 2-like [Apostichopus japonicus]